MVTVNDVLKFSDVLAPLNLAEEYDNCGLNVGSESNKVDGIVVAVDLTESVVDFALANKANLIITHHPAIFKPISFLGFNQPYGLALKNNISVICLHTCADKSFMAVELAKIVGVLSIKTNGNFFAYGNIYNTSTLNFKQKLISEVNVQQVNIVAGENANFDSILIVPGAGGRNEDIIEFAKDNNLKAILTSEVKHSVALLAKKENIIIFEVSHYDSEKQFKNYVLNKLKKQYKGLNILAFENESVFLGG